MIKTDESVSRVLFTYNYEQFRFLDSNRPADHWPKIAQSIEKRDLTPYVPILCMRKRKDGALYIIDGQNRFKACQHLGLPIHYLIIPDGQEDDTITLNVDQKNWTLDDYLNFYATRGVDDYLKMREAISEMEYVKAASIVNNIWRKEGNNSERFKNGEYTFPVEAKRKSQKVDKIMVSINENVEKNEVRSPASLMVAISSLLMLPDFDPARMIRQIKKYRYKFTAQADTQHYRDMLEELYNYRQSKKVSFRYAGV